MSLFYEDQGHSTRSVINTIDDMNTKEGDALLKKWATTDNPKDKTLSRRFVETLLLGFKWYDPNKDRREQRRKEEENNGDSNVSVPRDLREGWAYYEHITLPRFKSDHKGARKARATPGEVEDTELFRFFQIYKSYSSLNEWGVGIALYFSTMRVFGLTLFIGGLCGLRNIFYFFSEDYDNQQSRDIGWILKGSAICNSTEWVECEDGYCNTELMKEYDVTYATLDGGDTVFVQRLICPVSDTNDNDVLKAGLWNVGTLIVFAVITGVFTVFQRRQQTILDENAITASDYSIRVLNPPNEKDPEKWRAFFEKFDDRIKGKGVSMVSIMLKNAPLLEALRSRRHYIQQLNAIIPTLNINDPPERVAKLLHDQDVAEFHKKRSLMERCFIFSLRPILRRLGMYLDHRVLKERIDEKTAEIKKLQDQDFDVSSVIVTFETEAGKRNALDLLQASRLDITRNRTRDQSHLFEGRVLDIVQPAEPSALNYLHLDAPIGGIFVQFIITLAITLALIVLGGYLVYITRKARGAFWGGIVTTTLNVMIPFIVNMLMLIETHSREDDRQKSLYIKVTLFRWVNTAITAKFIVPFTSTLGNEKDDLLVAITGILIAEIWISPLLAVGDIMGNLKKHYFAPRAKTHEHMLSCFKGTYYNLADKYTDMTKIVFVCYYYCALSPSILFIGGIALTVRYLSDVFCLLRIWGKIPNIGSSLADFSRTYFLSFAIVAGIVVQAYDWALFNFDRVCNGETSSSAGTYDVTIFARSSIDGGSSGSISISDGATARVCNDSTCCQQVGFRWPPVPSRFESDEFKWMTDGQRIVTSFCGWLSVVVVVVFFFGAFGHTLWTRITSIYIGGADKSRLGKDQQIDFSNLEIPGYIPQIRDGRFAFNLTACDVNRIPHSLLGHHIADDSSLKKYNIINDVPNEGNDGVNIRPIFSVVKHWPFGGKVKDD